MMKYLAAALLLLFVAAPASAQVPPYTYPITVGTSSVQILSANTARKRLIFSNPNATALIAVCPAGPYRINGGAAVVAAINGPGCITLLPYQTQEISGSTPSGPQQSMPSAWVGIASAGSSAITVFEFE